MSETDKLLSGSIPETYDRYLVPLIFEKFAQDIAQRAAALRPRPFWKLPPAAAWSRGH
jgi:hypothetical protein